MNGTIDSFGYEIVRNVLDHQTLKLLETQFLMNEKVTKFNNPHANFNDSLVTHDTFSTYGHHATESLLEILLPLVSEKTGKRLLPTYSYYRIYYKNSEMKKHIDRPSCEISATLNISITNKPWPIFLEDLKGNEVSVSLMPGDLCIYRGCDVPHWRNTYTDNKQIQVFLHWVDAKGKHQENLFDSRPLLGADVATRAFNNKRVY